jgi:hypothetical protein
VGLLLFLNWLEFSITSFQSTWIIFCTMAASYILGTCYYENKKL